MVAISKKLGQLKQWTGEKFGTAEKTNASEDFRKMNLATETRREGIENMHTAVTDYAKTLDKKSSKDKKLLPIQALSKAMQQQSRLHDQDSVYGTALLRIGETQLELSTFQSEFVLQWHDDSFRQVVCDRAFCST